MLSPQIADMGFNPYRHLGGVAARYDANDILSMTVDSAGRVSLMADKSGLSAVNCFVSDGAASNTATSPTQSITGSQTMTFDIGPSDWTPGTNHTLFSKLNGNSGLEILLLTTGVIRVRVGDGAAITNFDSTAANTLVDITRHTLVVTYVDNTSVAFTLDGVALGTTVTVNKVIANGAATATIGTSFAGRIYRVQIGGVYDFNPMTSAKMAASFSSGGATWTVNTSGATGARICGERDLYQGTVANQPVLLQCFGQQYGYMPGASGAYYSTPSSAGLNVGANFCLLFDGVLNDWTNDCRLVAKYNSGASKEQYLLAVEADGKLRVSIYASGAAFTSLISSVATGFADLSLGAVRVDVLGATASATFYTAPTIDGPWVQLGTVITGTARTAQSTDTPLEIGSLNLGTSGNFAGRAFRARVISGTFAGGSIVANFDSRLYQSGPTFVASTGETWTINGGATIVTRTGLYFDGVNDYLKAAAFTLNQPETVYGVLQQVTWTSADGVFAGNAASTLLLAQTTSSPEMSISAGSVAAANTGLAVRVVGIVTAVFNGTLSALRINRNAAITGDANTAAGGGFTLGAKNDGSAPGNVLVSEVAIFSSAHNGSTQDRVLRFLGRKWGF